MAEAADPVATVLEAASFYEVFGVRKLYLEGTFEHVLRAACDVTTRNRAGSRSATRISS